MMPKTGYPVRHLPFLNASFSRYLANLAIKTPRRTGSVSSAVSDSGKSDYFMEKKEEKEFFTSSGLRCTDVKSASRNHCFYWFSEKHGFFYLGCYFYLVNRG